MGALGGSFFGLLLGLIFFVSVLGLAIGAAGGAVFGSMKEFGDTNAELVRSITWKIRPPGLF